MSITELDNHYDTKQMGNYDVFIVNDNKPYDLVIRTLIATGICDS